MPGPAELPTEATTTITAAERPRRARRVATPVVADAPAVAELQVTQEPIAESPPKKPRVRRPKASESPPAD
jgi:hypothetical protein